MKILCDAGLVTSRKAGKWIYYTRRAETLDRIGACLQALGRSTTTNHPAANCHCHE